ncbi:ribonuclease H-like domain-containing protein [Tanacetum coccineum]|uniref:Ribonuclease H-like domain-containing protein n=1 Tax=Tanacetum coccineum TaxID=301880 RepID=A0ABQ5C851_9ASTR
MSEPMPSIPTQSPFTYPNPNPSASPSFTQDDTSESFIPEPIQPMPTFTQTAFSQPADIIISKVGGNEESKKMRKTMLKQQFTEFSVTEEEGLHKGYDRFQKILSQLNQVQARPNNDDINLKFLRALPSSWSQVTELDVRYWSYYGVKAAAAPTHSAFIGAASSSSKLTYSDQQSFVPSVYQSSGRSDNIMECVLHSFVAENESDQDMIFEDFDQARYSAFKVTEVKTDEPKALVSVDSMVNWSDHVAENKTGKVENVYGMMAGLHVDNGGTGVSDAVTKFAMMGISPKAYQNAVKTLESQKDWYHKTQMALEEKIRVLSANLETPHHTETKIGLGFKDYFGKDEVFDLSRPSTMYPEPVEEGVKPLYSRFVKAGEMHAVPPSITGTYMPTPYKSDIEETQASYGSKSNNNTSETISESNDFVSCDTKSDVEDPNSTAGSPSFSCSENVKSPRIFCNKSGMNNRNVCKNNSVRKQTAVNSAGKNKPTERFWDILLVGYKRPALFRWLEQFSAGRLNPAARPYFRPSYAYFGGDPSQIMDIGIVDSGCSRSMTGNKGSLMILGISELQPEQNVTSLGRKKHPWMNSTDGTEGCSCTQDTDSDLEVDEQVIVVPSFPSNNFVGPSSSNGPSVMERNADYAEELAKLQRQEYEAKDAAARYGYLFSQETAEILSQAEAEIRNQGVSADRDPAGIDSAGGVSAGSASAGSDPAGGNPAGSYEPAGQGNSAVSTSVSADFIPVHAAESTLPPGQSLGSSENTTRFPVPSNVCKDQLSSGIFTSSSYDDDFSATLTNLAPAVEVNPVPTKRVNTIHPQSQILGDLASPVLTRSKAQKSKFGESAFIGYIQDQQRTNHTDQLHCLFACFLSQLEPTSIAKALEDSDWVAAMQEEMQQFINQKVWTLVPLPAGKNAIGNSGDTRILMNKRNARGIVVMNKARLVHRGLRQDEGIDYDELVLDSRITKFYSTDFYILNEQSRRYSSVSKRATKIRLVVPKSILLLSLEAILHEPMIMAGFSCLVSAGSTMILLVVILPAECFVSAGSYGLCRWFRVHAALTEYNHAASDVVYAVIYFNYAADWFVLVKVPCCAHFVYFCVVVYPLPLVTLYSAGSLQFMLSHNVIC